MFAFIEQLEKTLTSTSLAPTFPLDALQWVIGRVWNVGVYFERVNHLVESERWCSKVRVVLRWRARCALTVVCQKALAFVKMQDATRRMHEDVLSAQYGTLLARMTTASALQTVTSQLAV
jgi:hypothetical protein